MATAVGSDWKWSCGVLGCAISFNKGEGDLFSYLIGIFTGAPFAIVLAALAYFGIITALAATVSGIVVAVGISGIATLAYYCDNLKNKNGYWMTIWWGGFDGGCNPVPWYY